MGGGVEEEEEEEGEVGEIGNMGYVSCYQLQLRQVKSRSDTLIKRSAHLLQNISEFILAISH